MVASETPETDVTRQSRHHDADPMNGSSDSYVRFLLENRAKRFYAQPYSGNSGDTLILSGTRFLLARLGIAETLDPRDADVLLMPGGNPAMWFNIHGKVWRRCWERFPDKEFVVGPAGFAEPGSWQDAVLENASAVTALFARDLTSYRVLGAAGLPASIRLGLAQDPALHLLSSPWAAAHRAAATEEFVLISFRDDHEANVLTRKVTRYLPVRWRRSLNRVETGYRKNKKIAKARSTADPRFPVVVQDITKQNFDVCVETVRQAAQVHTDRLHVMLLAVLLGKRVFAYRTFYDKLEAVYEQSLRGWAEVEFVT